jgi:ribosome-binding factor A
MVSKVELSADLSHAKIYVYTLANEISKETLLEALARNGGFLRSFVAKALSTKVTPALRFFIETEFDDLEYARELFKQIESND